MKPFIETRSGLSFWPLKPKVGDILIGDIAHALANQCRFSGHTLYHYSVAQHSVGVSQLLDREGYSQVIQMWGLLHDASEAYLVDLPSPLKRHAGFAYYKTAEKRLMHAVCRRFDFPLKEPEAVRWADAVLLACEARDVMPFRKEHWSKLEEKPDPSILITKWTPEFARERFLVRYRALKEI